MMYLRDVSHGVTLSWCRNICSQSNLGSFDCHHGRIWFHPAERTTLQYKFSISRNWRWIHVFVLFHHRRVSATRTHFCCSFEAFSSCVPHHVKIYLHQYPAPAYCTHFITGAKIHLSFVDAAWGDIVCHIFDAINLLVQTQQKCNKN